MTRGGVGRWAALRVKWGRVSPKLPSSHRDGLRASPREATRHCIIWNNPLGSFAFSDDSTPSVTYSCIESEPVVEGEGNINIDPRFVRDGIFTDSPFEAPAIVDPGDYHLRPDSPCIDAGSLDDAPTTDIEGGGRPCGGGMDLGAHETGGCPPPNAFRRGDVNADGATNLTDAVSILSHLFGGGLEPTCSKSADADDTGTVDVTDAVYLLNFLFAGGPRARRAVCRMWTGPHAGRSGV